MTDSRLAALRAEGGAAIPAARTTAELEELRVRYLGRKSVLTEVKRSIGELPPAERGPRQGGNEVSSALEGAARGAVRDIEAEEPRPHHRRPRDVTLPATSTASGAPLLVTHPGEIEDVSRDRLLGAEGPEVEYDL